MINYKVILAKSLFTHSFLEGTNEFISNDIDEAFIDEIVKSSALNNVVITKEEAKNQFLSYMKQTSKREKEFFTKIKVKKELTTLGQDKEYLHLEKKGFNAWYYSVKYLKKLGLNNITIINGPWKYRQPFNKIKAFQVLIK